MLVDSNHRRRGNERRFSKREVEDSRKEMEKEHAWMQYVRYKMMRHFTSASHRVGNCIGSIYERPYELVGLSNSSCR